MNFGLNADGDLDLVANNLTLISGKDEIAQILKMNLQAVTGEWFLDTSLGLPWFDQILEKQNSAANIDAIFTDAIRRSEGVISVLTFRSSIDRALRTLRVEFSVATSAGVLTFNDEISPGET